jgi:hypothetical protein
MLPDHGIRSRYTGIDQDMALRCCAQVTCQIKGSDIIKIAGDPEGFPVIGPERIVIEMGGFLGENTNTRKTAKGYAQACRQGPFNESHVDD